MSNKRKESSSSIPTPQKTSKFKQFFAITSAASQVGHELPRANRVNRGDRIAELVEHEKGTVDFRSAIFPWGGFCSDYCERAMMRFCGFFFF